ncbi:MAG: radical SAM protein [Candidatus Korobacteraceae bacterium]
MNPRELIAAWMRILTGRAPMLSIEITRECPLSCPGCYAYNDNHLGGEVVLRELNDYRGDDLVNGVVELVRKHQPLHVSLVGGEPLVRHRELSRILPILSGMGVHSLVVTSGVIAIPMEWMALPRVRVAVSVDGLREDHDIRRKPATYERILQNIEGRSVNIHLTITRPMVQTKSYLEEYFAFWSERPEVHKIWISVYTPQVGETSTEKLTPEDRARLVAEMATWRERFPKLLVSKGYAEAVASPPRNPDECTFSKMSTNYSADLKSRVEPCVFGGTPDCAQCGCAVSMGFHWLTKHKIRGPLRVGHLAGSSVAIGSAFNRLRRAKVVPERWRQGLHSSEKPVPLVQISK